MLKLGATAILHFVLGLVGSLVFFVLARIVAGERASSAPFGLVFVGVACASLAVFLSPWATPAVVGAYGVASLMEARRDRAATLR